MPLKGGASDKYGNRFEGKWTAYCLARVMAEEIDSIHIEPPGPEGEGCEFWTKKGNITKYHQVKRQHAKPGGWDTSELFANKVLTNAFEKTIDQNSKFIFISTDSAGLLDELIDAAGKNTEYDKFEKFFLSSKDRKAEWNKILKGWSPLVLEKNPHVSSLPKEQQEVALCKISHEHLKRIEIRTLDEDSLKESVETKLRTFLKGDYEAARLFLADYALENIHNILFVDTLWAIMESRGYSRLDYSKDKSVLAAVDDCNKRYESMIRPISGNISIPRGETESVCKIILGDDDKHSVLVSGKAGVGKTFVLGESIKCIISLGIPHLYFRVDRLSPTELPERIGEQLRLPGSPVKVLGNIAKSRQSVLIIDQLDAVSTASGRNPEFFFCIDEIIRQAEHYPNMRLLMACRSFDLEKDNRFRELVSKEGPAQEVEVKLLSADAVKSTLTKLSYNPSEFSEKQIELLQLPLRLSIFAQMKCRPQKEVNKFSTSTDLFNDYWEFKEKAVRERIGKGTSQWINVIDVLCESMTEKQVLSVFENIVLDDFKETVRAMESEHVLVLEDKKVSFFHETFYDYSFARRFVSKGKDLIGYLKSGEQHLFKRTTLRQVLFHIYDHSHLEYLTAMGRILDDPNIRFHIKKCALELMGQLDYVDDEAWNLLKRYISDTKSLLFREVFFIFINSNSWFKFLDGRRIISEWLDSGNEDIHKHALFILNNQIKKSPKESVELLKPYIGKSPEWNQKILNIISYQNLHLDRNVYELFVAMIAEGMMDDDKSHAFWLCTYELSKKKPAWAAEALGLYLTRILDKININEIEHRFLKHDGTGERDLLEIAEKAPVEYLDNVLPFFMRIVLETAKEIDGKLKIDKVWCFRFYREKDPVSLEDTILLGLEKALRILAQKHPSLFIKHFDSLSSYGDYDSINFLLIRALAVCEQQFGDPAVGYLLENPQRLDSGWAAGGEGDFSCWPAYELTKHISQLCSNEFYLQLENCLLSYYPRWELSKDGHKWRGYWQCLVLPALAPGRRTENVKVRIGEWERKYPKRFICPPSESGAVCVPSPIPVDRAAKMNDEQWLKAVNKYNSDERKPSSYRDLHKGGPHQLSGVLQAETKKNPVRFAKLALGFNDAIHPYYYDAILRGLTESEAASEISFEVIRKYHSIDKRPGGRWIPSLIAKYSDRHIPDDIIHILGWLATESDDPQNNEPEVRFQKKDDESRKFNLETAAINCVRGIAADSIGSLLYDHSERREILLPYIEVIVNDPSVAVRSTAANALLALFTHDKDKAVELFLKLCDIKYDLLLASHHVDRFLYYANFDCILKLRPILRRMLDSKIDIVREAGARHVCLAQFSNTTINDMVDECIKGDDAMRKGVVEVASTNIFTSNCREFSAMTLKKYFNDPNKEIRGVAARFYRNTKKQELDYCRELINEFFNSIAFPENIDDIIYTFQESTADISVEIIKLCEAVIVLFEKDQVKPGDRLYYEIDKVAELVIRSYRQNKNEEYKKRCLDMIDKLLSINNYGISQELEKYER